MNHSPHISQTLPSSPDFKDPTTTIPSTSTCINDHVSSSVNDHFECHSLPTSPTAHYALHHSLRNTIQHLPSQIFLQPQPPLQIWMNYLVENEKEKQLLRNEIIDLRRQKEVLYGNDLKSFLKKSFQELTQQLRQQFNEEKNQHSSEQFVRVNELLEWCHHHPLNPSKDHHQEWEKFSQELLQMVKQHERNVTNVLESSLQIQKQETRHACEHFEKEMNSIGQKLNSNIERFNTLNMELLQQVQCNQQQQQQEQQWMNLFAEMMKSKDQEIALRDELVKELKDRHSQDQELWKLQHENLHQYAQELECIVEQLKEELQQQDASIQSLKDSFQEIELENSTLKENFENQVEEITQHYELELKEFELNASLEKRQLQDQYFENSLSLKSFIGQQEVEIATLRKEVSLRTRENNSLSQHCKAIEMRMQTQIMQLETELLELEKKNETIQQEYDQELDTIKQSIQSSYSNQIEELQNEDSQKDSKIDQLELEIQQLREFEKELQQDKKHFTQELNLMKQLYEDQMRELEFYKRAQLSQFIHQRADPQKNDEVEQNGEHVGCISITSYTPSHSFCHLSSTRTPRKSPNSTPNHSPSNRNTKLKFLAPSRNGIFM
ncbi:hypothetical protein FDP41_009118 [Naegleria fowleri]|uniref:Uncharacterized protein n=1 Tax=Naegleria fowleri TaxID=5763 RepID=A0A6A5BIK3_NAEFO|nr:uncharacterized protein FDP41_009118 [Naegleria fowleri]KAF0972869.1 hypothetical protein FDP41_009118 [Naegleria fowleri]